MKSWKTSLVGIVIAAVGGVAAQYPEYAKICTLIGSILTGIAFILARDNNKTSEQVGAGK